MTVAAQFTRVSHPAPTPAQRRQEILAAPGFGRYFTDHMVSIEYKNGQWTDARVEPYGALTMDPATMVFHYGQAIFEGLKAYRQGDGGIATFRIDANARRFRNSARRMAMAELPDELFVESVRQLLEVDADWVPAAGGEDSLYLRPFMVATEFGLGVKPADSYRYLLLGSPAGAYFPRGLKPVRVWLSTEYVRAAPGGTGEAKVAGNYAASLLAQKQAAEQGCDQVVWLDAAEHRYVEEMGTNNLFFVFGSGSDARLVTPELSGALLPGITRDSLLTLAADAGYQVEERKISVEEWRKGVESGEITEVFGCGTAAVVIPVATVRSAEGEFTVGTGEPGEVTMALRDTLTGIQRGTFADIHGWLRRMV
ncbi:branched-chain amino acid aminotransferase [Nocardia terpenica]|uniref:Branched-chain-amino-acid aminotransferase n=1 Tax=Nocardia terpenica TaxID=455432 RepID=A0A164MZ40_9NOCA|nr:branched-chain amino acid aminotransferase [Nocardia terpenica]KZM73811.1 branched chain amino acid aminotransferase [Nocardia terpenica]MBF6064554.1 branched-chain amino acid aminotransferase [Nocardia terpenica]MBF6106822.1 branched-chain amino acid aminotransferase [Nocardia terpenica]MBF6114522.1 branched-chain amino acid aminotransferase [Nocardia terpenica]MBF6121392.1 branched-chain amino acid aminotransferase [Nocardia terpenica]